MKLIRAEDIALLAVDIKNQRQTSRAVGIIFDCRNATGDANLIAFEIDDAQTANVTATDETHGSPPIVVATTGSLLSSSKQ